LFQATRRVKAQRFQKLVTFNRYLSTTSGIKGAEQLNISSALNKPQESLGLPLESEESANIKPKKELSIVKEVTVKKEKPIIKNQSNETIKEVKEEVKINVNEIVLGFEECRRIIAKLYKNVFSLSPNFKPTLNDTTSDLLLYIGAKAVNYSKESEFLKAFGISTGMVSEKYLNASYVPLIIKLSVWADKNKGTSETSNLLNGLLQTLFELGKTSSESNSVKIVKESITAILDYLSKEGFNLGI
jgi:hypothetical protein